MLAATYTMGPARAMDSQLTWAAYSDTEREEEERGWLVERQTLVSKSLAGFRRRHEIKQDKKLCVYGLRVRWHLLLVALIAGRTQNTVVIIIRSKKEGSHVNGSRRSTEVYLIR